MKERDTVIIPVRIKKDLLERLMNYLGEQSRNSFINQLITNKLKRGK